MEFFGAIQQYSCGNRRTFVQKGGCKKWSRRRRFLERRVRLSALTRRRMDRRGRICMVGLRRRMRRVSRHFHFRAFCTCFSCGRRHARAHLALGTFSPLAEKSGSTRLTFAAIFTAFGGWSKGAMSLVPLPLSRFTLAFGARK